jgi:hypothetical protein
MLNERGCHYSLFQPRGIIWSMLIKQAERSNLLEAKKFALPIHDRALFNLLEFWQPKRDRINA